MKEIQMKVLLTGALGNIGLYTVDALLEAGHDVVAFDLESSRTRKTALRTPPPTWPRRKTRSLTLLDVLP